MGNGGLNLHSPNFPAPLQVSPMNHSTTRIVGGKSKFPKSHGLSSRPSTNGFHKQKPPPVEPDDEIALPPEQHVIQSRTFALPQELIDLIFDDNKENRLTMAELRLLLTIDGYVKHRGIGCYASKKILAEKAKCSEFHVKAMLTKYIKWGLILDTGEIRFRNISRRILEASWSRAFPIEEEEWQNRAVLAAAELTKKYGCTVKITLHPRAEINKHLSTRHDFSCRGGGMKNHAGWRDVY